MTVNLLVSQPYVISIYAAFIFVTLAMNSQSVKKICSFTERAKKSSLVSENRPEENFFSHSPAA